MDWHAFFFWAVAAVTGFCALGVVLTQNIVRSATWLLFTLAGTSGVFFLLGADFVGATQLLVYVGGTLVLVVFGVMLTAQGPFVNLRTGAAEWAIATVVGLLLFGVLAVNLMGWEPERADPSPLMNDPSTSRNSVVLGEVFTGLQDSSQKRPTAYLLPFEIISVHLLVVLIGAAYLARAKRRRGAILS